MKLIIAVSALALALGSTAAGAQNAHSQHGGHGGHGAHGPGAGKGGKGARAGAAPRNASVQELQAAHHKMMRDMNQPYTGDPDVDFRVQMIPHHQGAIDMARVALRHARDPFTRQLAEAVILEQQREIAEMRAWLGNRGVSVSAPSDPTYVTRWNSYPSRSVSPGSRDESAGKSWAPGSGAPRR